MSLETWKAEFYPIPAEYVSTDDALHHNLALWIGIRQENLDKHDVIYHSHAVYDRAHINSHVGIIWKKVEGHPHAKLMMEYAQDCLADSRAYEKWEFSHHGDSSVVWASLNDHPLWQPGHDYRRKLSVIMIDGIEVPRPVSQPLTQGDKYCVALPGCSEHLTWRGDRFDLAYLNAGLVHLSKEAAEKHIEVLFAYNKKCCDA